MASSGILSGPIRRLIRLLLWIYFRHTEVEGVERVPESGPLLVAANHHNSLVDAMLLLAAFRRPLRVLAKDQLFGHPLIGPFLRGLGALPVRRRQEHGDDPGKNARLFQATTAALRAGEAILIFPEGRTQPEPVLLELRTGAARMLLEAEGEGMEPPVTLLPVGLVFENPGIFREGRALVQIGRPVPTGDLLQAARMDSEGAARELTARLAAALKSLIVEAPDLETLRLLRLLASLGTPSSGRARLAQGLPWLQGASEGHRRLLAADPVRVDSFIERLRAFDRELEDLGLDTDPFLHRPREGRVSLSALRDLLVLGLGAPLALAGILLHGLPYQGTRAAVRWIPHTDEEEGTDKIAAGMVFYPLFWTLEVWGAHGVGGWAAAAALAALLLPSGFFALAWQERSRRAGRTLRWLLHSVASRPRLERLRAERQALVAELEILTRLAFPEFAGRAAPPPGAPP
ncbi:MAG: 1-acyl-sn-glycerol-3-phosphate acyltransferase [Acidobacteria bacterium]|nr:1-acyl-sn-glycerol-3-phosphate acyltransferase [Acidobacteriota bacterium]